MLTDIDLPFITGEFGIVYRARLTRSILRKTECEIVAVKTIKGKDTIWCHLHVHNSKLLINDIVMRIVMCQF